MGTEQLQAKMREMEMGTRLYFPEEWDAKLYDQIWNRRQEFIDRRGLTMKILNEEFVMYMEGILNKALLECLENDEYEVSDEEFYKIICDAQMSAF